MGIEDTAGVSTKRNEWEMVMGVDVNDLPLEEDQLVMVAHYMMVHYKEKEYVKHLRQTCPIKHAQMEQYGINAGLKKFKGK